MIDAEVLWAAGRREGALLVGRDQTAQLMRIASITGAVHGRHRTRPPRRISAPQGTPTGPDQLWVGDFTYVWTLA